MTFDLSTAAILLITFLLFYLLNRQFRLYILLAASLVYIYLLDSVSLIWVLASSLIIYVIGILTDHAIEKKNSGFAKGLTVGGVLLCVLSLIVLKFSVRWNVSDGILKYLILPVGFSYYAFQAISYLVDIYKGKTRAELNPAYFLLYMCFFPKFVSGPIERPGDFLQQLKNLEKVRLFEDKRLSIAFPTLMYGMFMKLVVADRIGIYTPKLLEFPHIYGTKWLFFGMIMYTMQIYCDFAGYSAMAVGIGRLFGIRLTENFHAPYLSENITVFWRRWHISLSSWLRDHIYIPLGGNRKGFVRKCVNIMAVFLICGLWHGAGMKFIIWGFLHGIFQVIYLVYKKRFALRETANRYLSFLRRAAGTVITFFSVSVAWIFFGCPNTGFAVNYLVRMFTKGIGEIPLKAQELELGVDQLTGLIPVYIVFVILFDLIMAKTKLPFGEALQKFPAALRYLIEYALIIAVFILGVYGSGYDPADFMYMNF